MMVMVRHIILGGFLFALVAATGQAAISPDTNFDFSKVPPNVADFVYPNVLLNMSVETPMGGAAYPGHATDLNNDGDSNDVVNGKTECPGRPASNLGNCYFAADEFLGYFDPDKCYTYDSAGEYFEPSSTTADHTCSGAGEFSGNFMNWASMTAIDEFIWTMTGGKRLVDTKALTVIGRAHKIDNASWYPDKRVSSADNVDPSTVTPWGGTLYIRNFDLSDQIQFGTSLGSSNKGTYKVRIKACDSSVGLEENCKTYTDGNGNFWYKPEGLIQENAHRMRFGIMAYTNHNVRTRDGGVLRAAMKFVGPVLPDGTVNTAAEFGLDGLQLSITDPDSLTGGSVTKSGVINYINEFYVNAGYKEIDPLGELFYQCVRYYKNLGPTPETYDNSPPSPDNISPPNGGFPIITSWTDPIQYYCQNNYIIAINDVFAWRDKRVPGTYFDVASKTPGTAGGDPVTDFGEPTDASSFTDATSGNKIDVRDWTNNVGVAEGINWASYEDGIDNNADDYLKGPIKLGEILAWGTGANKPHTNGRRNSYYAAGLAYYAHTQDLRSDLAGKQTITTFMIDTQEYNANPLTGDRNVLYLTGKYGGFVDVNDDGAFDAGDTWDADGDGQPDNYVLASDPQKMVDGLNTAFEAIKEHFRAGTAAAVAPVNRSGEGAVYQAFYEPSRSRGAESVKWIGTVQSFFLDSNGYLRQDDGDGVLENYSIDKVVESFIDTSSDPQGVLKYYVYTPVSGYETSMDLADSSTWTRTAVLLTAITPLWNAREELETINNFTSNRTYSSASTSQRHILTWKDADLDRVVDSGEQVAFTPSVVDSNFFPHFDVDTETRADNIVKFIRGDDTLGTGFRNRSVDYDGDGSSEVVRLGDVISSSPKVVGAPFENYDILYGDSSYATFRQKYANRRQVVYVGANDGMLHAFNAGFYDESANAFKTQLSSETTHALGAELWAYVPKNLLPHLKWLTIPDYKHVYYMDGPIRVFDAKIFTGDADTSATAKHPGGWGTLLVAGMRYGGGNRTVDVDQNGIGTGTDHDFYSSYVLMDITDPESPPTLLAEIQGSNFNSMGFTLGEPSVVGFVDDASSVNEWYLVMGNGPDNLSAATSSGNARIFVYNLKTKSFVSGFNPYSTTLSNAFVGGVTSVDWDLDFLVDSVYVGTAGNNAGKLFKIDTGENSTASTANWTVGELLNANAPIMQKPSLATDEDGRKWVYASTGRLETVGDKTSTEQNYMYGVKDESGLPSTLQDVHNLKIYTNGSITDLSGGSVSGLPDFGALESRLESTSYRGWRRQLFAPVSPAVDPSERVLRNSTVFGGVVFTPSYTPNVDLCVGGGSSKLYGLYYKTGTAHPDAILTTDSSDQITVTVAGVSTDYDKVNDAIDLGTGVSSEVKLQTIVDSYGNITVTGFVQNEDGSLVRINPNLPINLSTGELSWRELRDEK